MKLWGKICRRLAKLLFAGLIDEMIRERLLYRHLVFGPAERLSLHPGSIVNNALFNTVSGKVIIEDRVFFGHSVSVLTGTHDADATGASRWTHPTEGRDIVIKRGAWIASNVTILGPCVIGQDAVVAACALVNKDVPPRSIVAGVPAKVIRTINETQRPVRDTSAPS